MQQCYQCLAPLTAENRSKEHIIPNSIGGRLKSDKLLCKKCNSNFGEDIDTALAFSYENLVALLGLERERKKDYLIKNLRTESGNSYHLVDGRIPTPSKPTIEIDGNRISIVARDKKQLREILDGQARKYPGLKNIDLSGIKSNSDHYLSEPLPLKLTFGGATVFRSIAKMAVNLYLHRGGQLTGLEGILEVIRGKQKNDNHVHHYRIPEQLEGKNDEVYHVITIKGSAEDKTLTAFVILFSLNGFIVNLSEDYQGTDFINSYSYDILSLKESEEPIKFDYPGKAVFSAYLQKETEAFHLVNLNAIKRHLIRLSAIIDTRHTERSLDGIINSSLEEAMEKNGNPKIFTEQLLADFNNIVSKRVALWLEHLDLRENRVNL